LRFLDEAHYFAIIYLIIEFLLLGELIMYGLRKDAVATAFGFQLMKDHIEFGTRNDSWYYALRYGTTEKTGIIPLEHVTAVTYGYKGAPMIYFVLGLLLLIPSGLLLIDGSILFGGFVVLLALGAFILSSTGSTTLTVYAGGAPVAEVIVPTNSEAARRFTEEFRNLITKQQQQKQQKKE
jgi:hypothetical protein